jgi:hypothetical protein
MTNLAVEKIRSIFSVVNVELLVSIPNMRTNGFQADVERRGNLEIRIPACDKLENLQLATREFFQLWS